MKYEVYLYNKTKFICDYIQVDFKNGFTHFYLNGVKVMVCDSNDVNKIKELEYVKNQG